MLIGCAGHYVPLFSFSVLSRVFIFFVLLLLLLLVWVSPLCPFTGYRAEASERQTGRGGLGEGEDSDRRANSRLLVCFSSPHPPLSLCVFDPFHPCCFVFLPPCAGLSSRFPFASPSTSLGAGMPVPRRHPRMRPHHLMTGREREKGEGEGDHVP